MAKRAIAGAIALGAAVTTLQVLNRRLRIDAAPPSIPAGTEERWRWRGYDVAATVAGAGPLVLFIHGIYAGSSSYEFRFVFESLARRYRVVAVDLLGCGRSERPDIVYSSELFAAQVEAALDRFGPAAAMIGSSLGAAFMLRAAGSMRGRVGAYVAICPTGLGTLAAPPGAAMRAVTAFFRSPVAGEAAFNVLASRRVIGWFLRRQAYGDPASATSEVIAHYWRETHCPGSRFVPAHFVGGALNCDISADLGALTEPLLVLWGERASGPSPCSDAPVYVARAQHARLATFARSRLLPHEEEPDAVTRSIEDYLTASSLLTDA